METVVSALENVPEKGDFAVTVMEIFVPISSSTILYVLLVALAISIPSLFH